MKLGKVTSNDPVVRLAASVRQSVMTQLEAYRAYYKSVYTEDIERSQLVEEMLRSFMNGDKDFVKFLESQKKANKSVAANTNDDA